MMRFIKRLCTWKLLPVSWTLLTIFLLCLPGSSIPSEGMFDGIDKVAHVILFGGIVFFWAFHLYFRRLSALKWRKTIVLLTCFSIALGIVLEFLQLYCIPNRSFDRMDIIADSAGALAAGLFHLLNKVR
jgi:VanZ family protein